MGDEGDELRRGEVRKVAASARQQDLRLLERLERQGKTDPRTRFLKESIQVTSQPRAVERLPDRAYAVPAAARRFLPAELLAELEDCLGVVKATNDEMVGLPVDEAQLLLEGDARVEAVEARLRAWAELYAEARVARKNPRDDGQPVARFERLYMELLPWFDEVAFSPTSIHPRFMAELSDHLPWLLYQRTWRGQLRWKSRGLSPDLDIDCTDPDDVVAISHYLQLYRWDAEEDPIRLRDVAAAGGWSAARPPGDEEVRDRLGLLALELREMRASLIRNFRPVRSLTQVCEGAWATWHWSTEGRIGTIAVAGSERDALESEERGLFRMILIVRADGLLAGQGTPWVTSDTLLPRRPDLLALNLHLLERLHARLAGFHARVDHEAVLRALLAGAAPTELSQEQLAATCWALERRAPPEPGDGAPSSGEAGPPVEPSTASLRGVRSRQLFALLRDRLGCEVRQGKGSEVVLFRPGGRIFCLGHHKANAFVPSQVVGNILKRLGISPFEWVQATR